MQAFLQSISSSKPDYALMKEMRFRFAMESLQKVMQIKSGENFLFSPENIYELLFCIYIGTDNIHNERRLENILHLSNIPKSLSKHYGLEYRFKNKYRKDVRESCEEYCVSNCICWIKKSKYLHNATSVEFDTIYKPETFDFFNSSVIHCINDSMQEKLSNHISYPLKFNVLRYNNRTELFLATVLCLKDSIQSEEEFQASSCSNVKKRFRSVISDKLRMKMNELPFKTQDMSLFILLPLEQSNPGSMNVYSDIFLLVNRLATEEGMLELRKLLDGDMSTSAEEKMVDPYFELEQLPVNEILSIIGAEEILISNLSGFLTNANEASLYVDVAMHFSRVKITPEEIIAGALTTIFTKNIIGSPLIQRPFDSTIPYIWLIYDKSEQKILFIGAMNQSEHKSAVSIVDAHFSADIDETFFEKGKLVAKRRKN